MDLASESDSDHKKDSLTRLKEYVREHNKLEPQQGGELLMDRTKDRNVKSIEDNLSSYSDSKTKSKRLSNDVKPVKHFMEHEQMSISSSSSSISSVHDYDDDYNSYSDGRRPSFFIESSKVSLSSDEEGDPLPLSNIVEYILAERGLVEDAIYNDWDSGLSHSSIEIDDDDDGDAGSRTNAPNLEFIFPNPKPLETGLDFPHRPWHVMECQICYEKEYLRRRVCCDFQICSNCLEMYLSGKVTDGKVQIECANDRCNALMFKDEIRYRLPLDMKEKFNRFLIDANKDPHVKTCPSCSMPYEIDPTMLNVSKKKLKHGVQVICTNCRLVWCFHCQAPFHSNITCKKYRNNDQMVKRWAKGKTDGKVNAQKCPKCKIFVQKMNGCDHMKCTECGTNFCYKCGDRYLSVKFFGSHWNRFSLFGCKYSLMPEKNGLRRLIRGSHFAGRVVAAVILAALGVAAGAVLVAGSVVILPGYGIFLLRRRMWAARQRKKFDRVKMRTIALAEKRAAMLMEKQNGNLETVVEESETETLEQTSNPQQIQVIVHQQEEEALMMDNASKDTNIIVNKYTSEDSEMTTASHSVTKYGAISIEDDFVTVGDVKETPTVGKVTKVARNVVSSTKEEKMEEAADSGIIVDDSHEDDIGVEKKEINISESLCQDASSFEKEVMGEEKKNQIHSELNPLQCNLDNSDIENAVLSLENCLHGEIDVTVDNRVCAPDVQNNYSLSYSLGEKIIMKSKVLKMDIDNKISTPIKANGDDGGKGCFGNIFNVGKRTSALSITNSNSNDEDVMKSYKEKTHSGDMKKAATWEKCQRSKVDMDSSSVVDTDSNFTSNLPLFAHKSLSSFSSSSVGYTFASVDDLDKSDSSSPDHPVQQPIDCDTLCNTEDCVNVGCVKKTECDTNIAKCICDESNHINKIQVQIADVDPSHSLPFEHNLDKFCQTSTVTHL